MLQSQTDCSNFGDEYKPSDLNDAIAYLTCQWSDSDKEEYKTDDEQNAVTKLHMGTGRAIRNDWGLWGKKSKLSKFFKSKGIFHPDDMSAIILTSFHRSLNEKPILFDEQIQYYKDWWESARKEQITKEEHYEEISRKEYELIQINDPIKIEYKSSKQGSYVNLYHIQKHPALNEEPECYVNGIVIKKKKKKRKIGKYVLYVEITDVCGYNEGKWYDETIKVGEVSKFSLMDIKTHK